MTEIYIPIGDFNSPPTSKGRRELVAAFPQIIGATQHQGPFVFEGATIGAGVVLETNQTPEPDEAAIVAFAVGLDGSSYPPRFGASIPLVDTQADLPPQPPTPNDVARLAAVANPPGLFAWARGQWRGPL